jgi:hypothetical protein
MEKQSFLSTGSSSSRSLLYLRTIFWACSIVLLIIAHFLVVHTWRNVELKKHFEIIQNRLQQNPPRLSDKSIYSHSAQGHRFQDIRALLDESLKKSTSITAAATDHTPKANASSIDLLRVHRRHGRGRDRSNTTHLLAHPPAGGIGSIVHYETRPRAVVLGPASPLGVAAGGGGGGGASRATGGDAEPTTTIRISDVTLISQCSLGRCGHLHPCRIDSR